MKEIDFNYVKTHLPKRPFDAHKGTMGTLVSVCGSYGYSGAAILSAKAALRTGVGLMYQILPSCIYPIFASNVHECVCFTVEDSIDNTVSYNFSKFIIDKINSAIAGLIGCGLKNTQDIQRLVFDVVRQSRVPLLIDADGINALSLNIDVLGQAKSEIVLTPHPKEFSRLTGLAVKYICDNFEKTALDFTLAHSNVTLVLKSNRTIVAKEGKLFVNVIGNSGMAKGGSGDVLSGIISSLMAQGIAPFDAAKMGVYIHAFCGDIAAKKYSRTSMLPSDIIECLSEFFIKAEES